MQIHESDDGGQGLECMALRLLTSTFKVVFSVLVKLLKKAHPPMKILDE